MPLAHYRLSDDRGEDHPFDLAAKRATARMRAVEITSSRFGLVVVPHAERLVGADRYRWAIYVGDINLRLASNGVVHIRALLCGNPVVWGWGGQCEMMATVDLLAGMGFVLKRPAPRGGLEVVRRMRWTEAA